MKIILLYLTALAFAICVTWAYSHGASIGQRERINMIYCVNPSSQVDSIWMLNAGATVSCGNNDTPYITQHAMPMLVLP